MSPIATPLMEKQSAIIIHLPKGTADTRQIPDAKSVPLQQPGASLRAQDLPASSLPAAGRLRG